MPLFSDPQDEIFSQVLLKVMKNTGITRTSPGSKARTIIESVVGKIASAERTFEENMGHAFLDSASGSYLDKIGYMLGVTRITETSASIGSGDKVIKFYRDDASLSLTIPAGTLIGTSEDLTGVTYRTVSQVTMPPSEDLGKEIYVTAISSTTGSNQNTGKETLVHHSIVNQPGLFVTNEAEITTGQDIEIDANFRFRISKQVVAAETANPTSIRVAIMAVPGVADVVELPYFRGVGTIDYLIMATTPSVPSSLLAAIREKISNVVAQGVSFDVRRPRETGVSMSFNLTMRNPLSLEESSSLKKAIQSNIMNYIDNLDIGEELIINEIIQLVMQQDDDIKNIGTAGKPIEELIVYKETELQDQKLSEVVFNGGAAPMDYTVEIDEKLLTHTDLTTPIKITIN
jgi:uncharacterized phage protein gp47/JayE